MPLAFIHTADWQIGKPFAEFEEHKRALLREARLTVIDRVAEAARARGAPYVLVAGDVFDRPTISDHLLRQAIARLAKHATLMWHLLPGNHDPVRAGGVWERAARFGLPANVVVHSTPIPVPLGDDAILLPSPLSGSSSSRDPTAWMDDVPTPPGLLRIGLAHGSVQGFGTEQNAAQQISPERWRSARLDYLALGDWHGALRVSDRVWYSGTPEPDRYRDNDPGFVLSVQIEEERPAIVERIATNTYTWTEKSAHLENSADWQRLMDDWARARAGAGIQADREIARLILRGVVPLAERRLIEAEVVALLPTLFHLEVDDTSLRERCAEGDDEIWGDTTIRGIAETLVDMRDTGDARQAEIARLALRKLLRLNAEAAARGAPEGA